MKLRRAVAAAAAAAVIAPASLMAASAAHATTTTDPSQESSTSAPAEQDEASKADETTPGAEEKDASGDDDSATQDEDKAASDDAGSTTPDENGESSDDGDEEKKGNKEDEEDQGGDKGEDNKDEDDKSSEPGEDETPGEDEGEDDDEDQGEDDDELAFCEDQNAAYESKLKPEIIGLPGKIVAGSGWHNFKLRVTNPSESRLNHIFLFAGVGPADEQAEEAFSAKQVVLEVKDPETGTWESVTDGQGHSVGFVGWTELEGDEYSDIELRVNAKKNAPIGAGLTIGGGAYLDEDEDCVGDGHTGIVIEIVAPGTKTEGTKPKTGGKTPIPAEKPKKESLNKVQGQLAATGADSNMPMFALAGAAAIAVGAGAMFIVRRRKAGDDSDATAAA
ncbi:LAETG motif-containing sortase-dependent surface protein [Streptomyces gobiensis]|uniref:LAETG motif-containing sortase-dependent surface protein n=1 Tax=Streptomyces gobiensis TaxID=2875706 RepID=UPI001E4878DF|nr:LAETG motif-containing sortase-dependent surface protein [Streptomyces gobiensis]UGY93177.1 LPXTG cell wall anchor domain-containing protein [Streptomyces gobiensis]